MGQNPRTSRTRAVVADRPNILNWRMLAAGLVSCAIVAAVAAGAVGWLS